MEQSEASEPPQFALGLEAGRLLYATCAYVRCDLRRVVFVLHSVTCGSLQFERGEASGWFFSLSKACVSILCLTKVSELFQVFACGDFIMKFFFLESWLVFKLYLYL